MIRRATRADAPAIRTIYAPYVTDTLVSFEFVVPDEAEFADRVESLARKFAWLVYEREGRIVGYAHASPHRAREGYKWSAPSVGLHESLGFRPIGVYRKVGWKLGRWVDTGWWQLELGPFDEDPTPPVL